MSRPEGRGAQPADRDPTGQPAPEAGEPAGPAGGTVSDDRCFCCGRDNPQGLKLSFTYPDPGRARTACTIPGHFTGWKEITHGGFLAMLLDETMAHACIASGQLAVTAELTVRYRTPVATGRTIRVEAAVTASRARIVEAEGRITDPEGRIVAEARGRFLKSRERPAEEVSNGGL